MGADGVRRKEGVGNIWTDNPYGGPMFLSPPDSVTGGFGGGAGFSLGGGGGSSAGAAGGGTGYITDAINGVASNAAGAGGGMTAAQITRLALTLGIPVAQIANLLRSRSSSALPTSGGLPPGLAAQFADTLGLMNDRFRSTIPVHDAAMRLALALAPNPSTPSPMLTAAIGHAATPAPQITPSPAVQAAIAHLAGRYGG